MPDDPDDDRAGTGPSEAPGADGAAPVVAPATRELSGSVEVVFSSPGIKLPPASDAVPAPIDDGGDDDAPPELASERSAAVRVATELGGRVGKGLGDGVGKVGGGIATLGGGIARLGERVERLPAGKGLGAGVRDLGAGVTDIGASLGTLPAMAKTSRGRVLVRGLIVGLTLVAIWIVVIVLAQLRGGTKPNLRPVAEALFAEIRDGKFEQIYDASSPRFRELMIEERFLDLMDDMARTLGPFVEIAAVNDTLVTNGPGGRIARVDMLVQFEKGKAKSTLSLQWSDRAWKMLGFSVDLPDELIPVETSQEARRARVSDPQELARVEATVRQITAALMAGQAEQVWRDATPVFQASVSQADFARVERERRDSVGRILRYLDTTFAQTSPSKTGATVVALIEHEAAVVTARFGLERTAGTETWRLASYKVILPMPLPGATKVVAPPSAADGSAAAAPVAP